MKKCRECDVVLTEVNRIKHRRKCKTCYYTHKNLLSRYGITLEEKRRMWREQDGKCVLCDKQLLKSKDCNVDHDHETGIVRKLLCRRCNGFMAAVDDVMFLEKAVAYREQYLPENHPEKIAQKNFPANKRTVPVSATNEPIPPSLAL